MKPAFASRVVALSSPWLLGACTLLQPYPGGKDPAQALQSDGTGPAGGTPQDPLVDPPEDGSVAVLDLTECPDGTPASESDTSCTVALPGAGFPIHLGFQAPQRNVVGGGIRIEDSPEVQWTLLQAVKDQAQGEIEFSYVLPDDVCDGLSNLCHTIRTQQFAVVADGNGGFAVSKPVDVEVVLQCATCDSKSCTDALPTGSCQVCAQPDVCKMLYDNCYAPGQPSEGSDYANIFDVFLGPTGTLWSSAEGCFQGEAVCQNALDQGTCELSP